MSKLYGGVSFYMLGAVLGITIASTAMANKAREIQEQRQQEYLQKKQEKLQKLVKSLEHIVSTENGYNGAITKEQLKKYHYSNAFDLTAGLDLADVNATEIEEKVKKEQVYASYKNMQSQARKMYLDIIKDKKYKWPDSITSYKKDVWGRDFSYNKINNFKAKLSFNLPWNASEKKSIMLKLPKSYSPEALWLLDNFNEIGDAWKQYYLDTGTYMPKPVVTWIAPHAIYHRNMNELKYSSKSGWKGPYLNYPIGGYDYYMVHPLYEQTYFMLRDYNNVGWCSSSDDCYLWIQITTVPAQLAEEFDEMIDKKLDHNTGAVILGISSTGNLGISYRYAKTELTF